MLPFQVMNSEQKIDQLTHLWNLLITFLLALAVPHTRKKMLHKERRTIEDSTSVTLSCPIFTNHIHRQYSSTSLMTLSKTNECCWRTQCLLVFLRPMFMVFFLSHSVLFSFSSLILPAPEAYFFLCLGTENRMWAWWKTFFWSGMSLFIRRMNRNGSSTVNLC